MLAKKPQRRNSKSVASASNREGALYAPKSFPYSEKIKNKKEPPKSIGNGSGKNNLNKSRYVIVKPKEKVINPLPKEHLGPTDAAQKDVARIQKEQEMLELMRRHQARLKERFLNGGNIVDLLGGFSSESFWAPPSSSLYVPTHPLTPDLKGTNVVPLVDERQDLASKMDEDPSTDKLDALEV
ncbi:putative serine protease nudel [Sesbania bispinosa]|nr:putative serine protease nudel [Sesbania bispinosa]